MKICWNVTNQCNANCKHCFRDINTTSIPLQQNLKILDKLKNIVDHISFSGGEALLYDGFFDLLKETKKYGITCSLTTNSLELNEKNISEYLNYLDRITFSIDFSDDSKNIEIGRGENYCEHLEQIITLIRCINPSFRIKVNTVVIRENLDELENIFNYLKRLKIDTWKLLRFCPYRNVAKANAAKLNISDEQWNKVKSQFNNFYGTNVIFCDIADIESQFFINAKGDLCVGKNNQDIVLLPELYNQDETIISNTINKIESPDELLNANLNLYKAFYYVAKEGNISTASKKMYISQPALSKAIKRIESELNVTLFNRTTNGVMLTNEGEKLLSHLETVFNYIKTARQSVFETSSFDKGYLRIGVPSHIGNFLIFDYAKNFRELYPNVKISIVSRSSNELMNLLNSHELDFVIDVTPKNVVNPNLEIVHIASSRHIFVCKDNMKSVYGKIKNLHDLQDKPLILPVEHSSHRKNLNYLCDRYGVVLNNYISIETSEMILNAVNQNLGIGYILYDLVKKDINNQKLFEIKIEEELPSIEISLIFYDKFLTDVPRQFIKEYLLSHNPQL